MTAATAVKAVRAARAAKAAKRSASWSWSDTVARVHRLDPDTQLAQINHKSYVFNAFSRENCVNHKCCPFYGQTAKLLISTTNTHHNFHFAHPIQQEHSNQEMDLEDLIAPSKVSRPSNPQEGAAADSESHAAMDDAKKGAGESPEDHGRGGRRTRSKRPRSGEEFEQLPERKRELRSSASRLARLAEEKMSRMQSASSNESINE